MKVRLMLEFQVFSFYIENGLSSFQTLVGSRMTTTHPYLPHRTIDPLDPPSYPQGVPPIQGIPTRYL